MRKQAKNQEPTKMSTLMRRLSLPLVVTVSLLVLSAATGQQAEAVMDGQVLQALAPELDNAQLGRMEALSSERRQKVAGEDHIQFRYEMDLNSDGQQELVLMGNYAAAAGRRGFVLIASQKGGQWVRSQVLTFDRDFVIGLRFDNRLAVNFCTGCSTGGWIEWTGSEYEFRPYPPQGVPGVE